MWKQTALTRQLGLSVPIIQGPFGGGLSSVELTALVSEAGGMGSFGAHHQTAEQIMQTVSAIRERTRQPFAINLWIPQADSERLQLDEAAFAQYIQPLQPFFDELGMAAPTLPEQFWPPYAEQVEAVLAARPPVFSFVFGIPSPDILQRCRERGIQTLGAATTVDEAVALEQAGVDMIVATGFEAGGHRVSFLRSAEASLTGTFALVPQVVDAVKVPVIAAGGIADGRGIAAALTLGAHGAQIGTAFLACQQSSASALHRQMLFSPQARYTGLTRAFSGRLARGIRNRLMDALQGYEASLPPYPLQYWVAGTLKAAALAQGRADLMALWCGQSAALLRETDAATLMASLVAQTEAILAPRLKK